MDVFVTVAPLEGGELERLMIVFLNATHSRSAAAPRVSGGSTP